MSTLTTPLGWRTSDDNPRILNASNLRYLQLSKPYKMLLENEDMVMYLIRCGDPEHGEDPKSCYIIHNVVTGVPARIIAPETLEEIYEVLSLWHFEIRDPLLKLGAVEKLPEEEIPAWFREFPDTKIVYRMLEDDSSEDDLEEQGFVWKSATEK